MGDGSAVVFDCLTAHATACVTQSVARNADYWREVVFPLALGLMAPALRTVPLHAACFLYKGQGVLIGARSGAGKSTLSATFARRGLPYVSDDWVYLTGDRGLRVHAMPVALKLLPDAVRFFPEFGSQAPVPAQNGELSIAFDPAQAFSCARSYACDPETVILFERVPGAELQLREATCEDLLEWFSEPLDCVPECLEHGRQEQVALIRRLRERRCYLLSCDGLPDDIATTLLRVCDGEIPPGPAVAPVQRARTDDLDLLRRGIPAPYRGTVLLGDATVAVASNSPTLLRRFAPAVTSEPSLSLIVIVEARSWPESNFSMVETSPILAGIVLEGGGFLAFDRSTRQATAFVTEEALHRDSITQALLSLRGCDLAMERAAP